jgi:hypothetical protein
MIDPIEILDVQTMEDYQLELKADQMIANDDANHDGRTSL